MKVLVPPENLLKQVVRAQRVFVEFKPGLLAEELLKRAGSHFGARSEEQNKSRLRARELNTIQPVVCTRAKALLIERVHQVHESLLDVGLQARALDIAQLVLQVLE